MLDAIDAHAKEALGHIYQSLIKTPEFTLLDGTKCRVERYYEPTVNPEGKLDCGFDVRLSNGNQLEFTIGHTGWGKSFADELAKKRRDSGKHR